MNNEDARNIAETLGGDTAAFGQLVDRYQGRLFSALIHVTGSHDEAEDVAQEAFVQAYSKLDRFEGRAGFYTWVYRIAFNLWISRRRRKRPTVSVDGSDAGGIEPADSIETPLAKLERDERVQLIRRALEQLPDEARAILVMREMDGFSYETMADVLDVPVGTVRSRLHRARMQMRRQLEITLHEPT